MSINTEWHARHRLSDKPTVDQRVKWHIEHARHCACRSVDGELLDELQRRYANTHQEFWVFFNSDDHRELALWAADCAEQVLPLFDALRPLDSRPREAIRVLREWTETRNFSMPIIRGASLAAHAAAREADKAGAACFAARAAGHAVATAHVPTHALGSALYALKAVAATNPTDPRATIAELRAWQVQRLPENLREWVDTGIRQRLRSFLPPSLRT
ncbi:MAG: putative immunity protein [Chloroflexota bacterium]